MKDTTDISGLRAIKSMHSTGKRSIPRVQSSAFLDLYMLRKEKDRLDKEDSNLERRRKEIQKRLDEILKQMDVLEKSASQEGVQMKPRLKAQKEPNKEWKSITLNY